MQELCELLAQGSLLLTAKRLPHVPTGLCSVQMGQGCVRIFHPLDEQKKGVCAQMVSAFRVRTPPGRAPAPSSITVASLLPPT